MPMRAPRICGCGKKVAAGVMCACQLQRAAERKARHDAKRPSARERGYDGEWDRARAAFLKVNPVCRSPGCGAAATVVDHIQAHKGNRALFWNRANWQPLCVPCHSGRKQSEERRGQ